MLMKIFFHVVTLATLLQVSNAADLPNFMQVCKKSNPNLEPCIVRSMETLKKYLANGISEYDIPPLEPLEVGLATISHNGLEIVAEGSKFYGLSSFEVKKLRVMTHAKHYKLKLLIPLLYCEGNYIANGRFFNLPHRGVGRFRGNFTGVTLLVQIKINEKIINGKMHADLGQIDMKLSAQNGRFLLDRFLNGKAQFLQDLLNQSINENFQIWSKELYPAMEKTIVEKVTKIINEIFSRIPKDQLFPV